MYTTVSPIYIQHNLHWIRRVNFDRRHSAWLELRDIDHRDDGFCFGVVGRSIWRVYFQLERNLWLLIYIHAGLSHTYDLRLCRYSVR